MDNSDLSKGLPSTDQADTVNVLYFARLKEALACGAEHVALPAGVATVAQLREHLGRRGGVWASELAATRAVRVAVNQSMATDDTLLRAGDEVAFFPPVTGG